MLLLLTNRNISGMVFVMNISVAYNILLQRKSVGLRILNAAVCVAINTTGAQQFSWQGFNNC